MLSYFLSNRECKIKFFRGRKVSPPPPCDLTFFTGFSTNFHFSRANFSGLITKWQAKLKIPQFAFMVLIFNLQFFSFPFTIVLLFSPFPFLLFFFISLFCFLVTKHFPVKGSGLLCPPCYETEEQITYARVRTWKINEMLEYAWRTVQGYLWWVLTRYQVVLNILK